MYAARRRDQWAHTGNLLCTIANCHRDPKVRSKAYEIEDFLPKDLKKGAAAGQQSRGMRLTKQSLQLLRPFFK